MEQYKIKCYLNGEDAIDRFNHCCLKENIAKNKKILDTMYFLAIKKEVGFNKWDDFGLDHQRYFEKYFNKEEINLPIIIEEDNQDKFTYCFSFISGNKDAVYALKVFSRSFPYCHFSASRELLIEDGEEEEEYFYFYYGNEFEDELTTTITPILKKAAADYKIDKNKEKALEAIKPFENFNDSHIQNDIGVVYERVNEIDKAFEHYKRSNVNTAINNILRMHNNDKIKLTKKQYFDYCHILQNERNTQGGYINESIYYQNNVDKNPTYKLKAINILLEGIEKVPESKGKEHLYFELAYVYDIGYEGELGYEKANAMYKSFIIIENSVAGVSANNLGFNYLEGKGVKKNVTEAYKLFNLAIEHDYYKSYYGLARIYDPKNKYKKYANEEEFKKYKELYETNVEGVKYE